jgi:hypothetical protein
MLRATRDATANGPNDDSCRVERRFLRARGDARPISGAGNGTPIEQKYFCFSSLTPRDFVTVDRVGAGALTAAAKAAAAAHHARVRRTRTSFTFIAEGPRGERWTRSRGGKRTRSRSSRSTEATSPEPVTSTSARAQSSRS